MKQFSLEEHNALMKSIYSPGDLLTVVRGDESITSFVVLDEDEDLYLKYCGAITNIYGGTIYEQGWNVVHCRRANTAAPTVNYSIEGSN